MAAVRCDLEDFAAGMFESFARAQVAADGVVPPVAVYFPQPWASGTPEQTARNIVQNHWWTRGDWREDSWRLLLAVFRDGQVIGQQNPSTRDVRITREARTGFWLGRRFQGRAFGTQMRAAALHLAFSPASAPSGSPPPPPRTTPPPATSPRSSDTNPTVCDASPSTSTS
ncbi:GNAT family N-acetyltransferase [Streptomyces sp. CG4]|uniref:GNAT family N-acetyltransferase n=1 Tax=Streptomyces sp. CG4 TaxID=408783 RepID=UPI0034E2635C